MARNKQVAQRKPPTEKKTAESKKDPVKASSIKVKKNKSKDITKPKKRTSAAKRAVESAARKQARKVARAIRDAQSKTNIVFSGAPFCRLLRDVLQKASNETTGPLRISAPAIPILKEAAQGFLIDIMKTGNEIGPQNRKHQTLKEKDIKMAAQIEDRIAWRIRGLTTA